LPQVEATLLRRLSVFAGGGTLGAAEAIARGEGVDGCGLMGLGSNVLNHQPPTIKPQRPSPKPNDPEVRDVLAALEDGSLMVVEEATEGLRYRMLETGREYAREKLRECGEEPAVRTAHAAYFLVLAETAEAGIRGPEQLPWLNT